MLLIDYLNKYNLDILNRKVYVVALYIDGLKIERKVPPTLTTITLNTQNPNINRYYKFALGEHTKGNKKILNVNTLHSIFTFKVDSDENKPSYLGYVKTYPYNSNYILNVFDTLEEAEEFFNAEKRKHLKMLDKEKEKFLSDLNNLQIILGN